MRFVSAISGPLLVTLALSFGGAAGAERDLPGLSDDLPTREKSHPEVSVPAPPRAQEAELGLRRMMAGFECAILAGRADKDGRLEDEMSRLLAFAYLAGKVDMPEFVSLPGFQEQLGPAGAFLTNVSDDFWIGMFFQTAAIGVDKALEEHAPYDASRSYQMVLDLRSAFASAEYQRKNCELVGR